jgi:protein involved in polysaccharide export with SLBB domain
MLATAAVSALQPAFAQPIDAAPSQAAAVAQQQVPPASTRSAEAGTVLNVGDIVQVVLPGEDTVKEPFRIDRQGRIEIPEAGSVRLAGATLGEAKQRVRAALASYIRDLSRFDLVLKEHRILVTVGGYVRNPGTYELSGEANVQQAVAAAGGMRQGAQLDRLQLQHEGRATRVFDYKRFLEEGQPGALPRLDTLDTIFVPSSPITGNVEEEFDARFLRGGDAADSHTAVRVMGEVNAPGSYAYRDGMTVLDALTRANGPDHFAATEQIRVVPPNGEPYAFNFKAFADTNDRSMDRRLVPGTIILVPAKENEIKTGHRVAYVMGEVDHPGAIEMRDGTGFMDLLANAGGPTRFADTRLIRIIRENGKVDGFDLSSFTNGGGGAVPTVHGGDAILVPEKAGGENDTVGAWLKTPPDHAVKVVGAVRNPSRLQWSNEESILDLLAQVNGPAERSDLEHVKILQSDGRQVVFNLRSFLDKGGRTSDLPRIEGGATVEVPEIPASPSDQRDTWILQPADQAIYIMGAVGNPGRYAFKKGLGLLDILSAADGPRESADIFDIRVTHRGEDRDRVSRVNLSQYFDTGDERLLPDIKPGDVVYVPDRNGNWLEKGAQTTVRVLGSVGHPGRFPYNQSMTLLDLLAEAGGPNQGSYQSRIIVLNVLDDGTARSTRFDLPAFARSGDYRRLPLVRPGDTVYVPGLEQSDWHNFFDNTKDIVSILALGALIKGF